MLPEVTAGMMEASTTRRRCSPFTLHGEHKNTHRYNVRTDNLISDEKTTTLKAPSTTVDQMNQFQERLSLKHNGKATRR